MSDNKKDNYNIFGDIHNYIMDKDDKKATYVGMAEVPDEELVMNAPYAPMPVDPGTPYDAEGGHTKEEAEAEYAKLFRELHGDPSETDLAEKGGGKVFIVGHINPDTDAIASAIAYANLKNKLDESTEYIPVRAGKINEETGFVLESAGMEAPEILSDAGTQIEDIDIRKLPGIRDNLSLKKTWKLLKDKGIVTVPITDIDDNDKEILKGLITITDIGNIYMDPSDTFLLSNAETSYENIREAVDGKLLLDDDRHRAANGKVVVGSGDFVLISEYVKEGDIVIVSNRSESHKAAINAGASLIIATLGIPVEEEIIEQAKSGNCAIITTHHDTYTTARLMNQSIPVSYVMAKDGLITFSTTDYLDNVKKIMSKQKHRDFPVLDEDGFYVGMISRRFLVDTKSKKVILVDHNEKSQAIEDIDEAEIIEIIDHHRLSSVETFKPVFFRNEPVGSTSTIIYEMYRETGTEIEKRFAHLMCAGILSDTLMFKSPTTSKKDKIAAVDLANIAGIDMTDFSSSMFRAGSEIGSKNAEDIVSQDFKKFAFDGKEIGIGQLNFMAGDELEEGKLKVLPLLENERTRRNLDMLYFMLTDIVKGRTEILFSGKEAGDVLAEAFEIDTIGDTLIIEGLVSRKKQLVPEIIEAMQQ